MAKITRATQKIFASNSTNTDTAAFGTAKSGTPTYTKDVSVLQSNAAFIGGWASAIEPDKAPFMEDMNGLQLVLSSQIAYCLQEGIAEWDAGTTYYQGGLAKATNGSGDVYVSLTNDNINNALSDSANWKLVLPNTLNATVVSQGSTINEHTVSINSHTNSINTINNTMVKHSTSTQVGDANTPIFVSTNGDAVACSGVMKKDMSNSDKPYVKTTYVSSDKKTGYEIYDNGYCVQWGVCQENVEKQLLKSYSNTNYLVIMTAKDAGLGSGATVTSASKFMPRIGDDESGTGWAWFETRGYLAAGQY